MLLEFFVLPSKDLLLETAITLDRSEALVHFCDVCAQARRMTKQLVVSPVLLPYTDTACRGCLGKPLARTYATPDGYKVFTFRQRLKIDSCISPRRRVGETVGLLIRRATIADGHVKKVL